MDRDKQKDEQDLATTDQASIEFLAWGFFLLFLFFSLVGIPLIPVKSLCSRFNLLSSVGLQVCVCYYIFSDLEQEGQLCPLTLPSTPIPRPQGLSLQV